MISKEQASYIDEYRNTRSDKLKELRWNGRGVKKNGKISDKWKFLVESPFKISDKCCDYMKKSPAKTYEKLTGNHPMIAVMAGESSKRTQDYLRFGCNAFESKRQMSRPMGFWTEQDVLQYLKEQQIPYASVYGDIIDNNGTLETTGEKRTGCLFCMFGVHLEKGENKFQRMQRTHPKLWNYCIHKLGLGKVLDYIGVNYEKENA